MSGKLSRYRRLAPHLTQHRQRPALPGSNRTDLSREAFAWLSMTALGLVALRLALASSSVSSDMVTSAPSAVTTLFGFLQDSRRCAPQRRRRGFLKELTPGRVGGEAGGLEARPGGVRNFSG